MKRRTKIVCTLGPAVDSKEKVKALIDAGMNVARLNCSHGDWEARRRWIGWIRELSPDVAPIAVLADLQGPKFRIGDITGGATDVIAGQSVTVGNDPLATIPIRQPEVLQVLCPNCRLLLGDGQVELRVGGQTGELHEAKAISGGTVKSRQGVTVVGKHFDCPPITGKDLEDTAEAVKAGCDFIALSYVRTASDMRDLRKIVEGLDPTIRLCAKIETREALKGIDDILKVADLIMVARGDMGLQMDIEEVPLAQKHIIQRCTIAGKPVITATQMLESMMQSPRPTRAEATDVANAILDGTDAVMLSGETAAGMYPIECVKTMVRIAERAETAFDRDRLDRLFFAQAKAGVSHTEAVAYAATELAAIIRPAAIITTTSSGQTARLVSKFRPKAPILCATYSKRTLAQLAVVWGTEAVYMELPQTTDESVERSVDSFLRLKRLKLGDLVVITAGVPAGVPGNTNMILTQVVK
jgi:pyruvate kinase